MITFDFGGTSHGEGYFGVIKGVPSGVLISADYVNEVLAMRKGGLGRSSRQKYTDNVLFEGHENEHEFRSDGSDIKFFIPNACVESRPNITAIRTGHADLVGQKRYPNLNARDVAEIASARSSVCYVVLGSICKEILADWGIYTGYFVEQIGSVVARHKRPMWNILNGFPSRGAFPCYDEDAREQMLLEIAQAKENGNSLGGVVSIVATTPMGIGEVFPYHQRLDAQIAGHLMGIPSVKGVSFGIGQDYASLDGVQSHDEVCVGVHNQVAYRTNKCGGIVGGITTGKDLWVNLVVKPVPTVKGVQTVDTQTLQIVPQHYERADTCVVPTVGLVAEHILCYVLANQVLKQYEQDPTSLPKKRGD